MEKAKNYIGIHGWMDGCGRREECDVSCPRSDVSPIDLEVGVVVAWVKAD